MPPILTRERATVTPAGSAATPGQAAISTLVTAVLVAAASGCTTSAPAAPAPPPPASVQIETVALVTLAPITELTGRVEAIHSVAIRPRISGYVTSLDYREGDVVSAGTPLFTIDPRPYRAVLARATAELARTEARVTFARADAARTDRLVAANAVSGAEGELGTSSAAQAVAEVAAARAAVDLARLDVEDTRVRAPLPGRTGYAHVSVGDYVAAGPAPALLTTLVSVDPVYVYFTGDEPTFLRFASHARDAEVAIGLADEPGYPHAGKIDFVDNHLDAATGTIALRAVVPNPDHRLTPGLFARVRVGDGGAVQAIAIDDKAVLTDQDRKYVYVLGADGTVARKDIKLGRIVGGRRVVDSGLVAGDRVIIAGIQKVFPGSKAAAVAPIAGAHP